MRLNVELKSEIYDLLVARAADEGRSVSDVVRVLVNDWLLKKCADDLRGVTTVTVAYAAAEGERLDE